MMLEKSLIAFVAVGIITSNQLQLTAASQLSHAHKLGKRATVPNFEDFMGKMNKTNQILNGITLYNKILNGTASGEIGKLLGLPSIPFNEIENFEDLNFHNVLNNLQILMMSNYVQNTNDPHLKFINLEKFKKMAQELTFLYSLPSDLSDLNDLVALDTSALRSFNVSNTISLLENRDSSMYGSITAELENCTSILQSVSTLNFDDIFNVLDRLEPLEKFKTIIDNVEILRNVNLLDDTEISNVKSNIDLVNQIIDANLNVSGFKTIQEVFKSLKTTNDRIGSLKGLPNLVNEAWFQAAVGSVNLQDLQALEPLLNDLEALDMRWKNDLDIGIETQVNTGGRFADSLVAVRAIDRSVLNGLKMNLDICQIPTPSSLNSKLSGISPFLVSQKVKTLMRIFEISIPTLSSSPTDDEISNVIDKLKKVKIHIEVFERFPASIESDLNSESNFIAALLQDSDLAQYLNMINCVNSLSDDVEKVASYAHVISQFGSMDTSFFNALNSTTTALLNSTNQVQLINSKMSSLPQNGELQTLGVVLAGDAQSFDSAMKAVFSIQKVDAHQGDFQQFLDDGHLVAENLVGIPSLENCLAAMEQWGDYENVEREKVKFLVLNATQKIGGTKQPAGYSLVDFAPIFTNLTGLGDVNFTRKLEVIDSYPSSLPVTLISSIRTISTLELKFSNFDSALGIINSTLNSIQDAFQSIAKTTTPAVAAPTVPIIHTSSEEPARATKLARQPETPNSESDGKLNSVSGGAAAQKKNEEEEEKSFLTPTLIGLGAVLFVVGLAVGIYLMLRNHKKEKASKLSKINKRRHGKKSNEHSGSEPIDSGPDDFVKYPTVAKLSKEVLDVPNDPLKSPPEEGDKDGKGSNEKGSTEAVGV